MKTYVLTGSKNEIAESLVQLSGEVREAIVFIEESDELTAVPGEAGDLFAEMDSFMMSAPRIEDSREAIYAPMDDE
jgi:hypothetical protein